MARETSFELQILPGERTHSPTPTTSDYFKINFWYTYASSAPILRVSFNHTFKIPSSKLYYYDPAADHRGVTRELHHAFSSSLPIYRKILYSIVPRIGERARDLLGRNRNHDQLLGEISEMNVTLHVTTRSRTTSTRTVQDEGQDAHHSVVALANSLERVKMDDDEDDNDNSCPKEERCAICLEDLCHASSESKSSSKLVRTLCSHVFHQHCILKWLQHSVTNHSCPLCRHQIL